MHVEEKNIQNANTEISGTSASTNLSIGLVLDARPFSASTLFSGAGEIFILFALNSVTRDAPLSLDHASVRWFVGVCPGIWSPQSPTESDPA